MKFHFFTSDYKLDYPEVGWIPQLEIEPWNQWSDFHMEEYPELILYQLNGIWTLYVSALDSGRKDRAGQVNRLSWVIVGNVNEGTRLFGFLRRIVPSLGKNDAALQSAYSSLLSSQIHEGDPEKWSHKSQTEKQRIANELGRALLEPSPSDEAVWPEPDDKWFGGDNNDSREAFLQSCFYLLTTKVSTGAAISLVKLGVEQIQNDSALNSDWEKLAVLISDNVSKSPMPEPTPKSKNPDRFKIYQLVALAVVALALLICIRIPVYNYHCNQRAIELLEQFVEVRSVEASNNNELKDLFKQLGKERPVITPKVLKRVEALEENDMRAKSALNAYSIALVDIAVQDKQPVDSKALERVLNLATTDAYAAYAAGCYYYSINDLQAAKECFTKSAKEYFRDSSAKLEEIDKKLKNGSSDNLAPES